MISYLPSVASRTTRRAFWLSSKWRTMAQGTSRMSPVVLPLPGAWTLTVCLAESTLTIVYRIKPLPSMKTMSSTLGTYFAMHSVSHSTLCQFQPCGNQMAPVPQTWSPCKTMRLPVTLHAPTASLLLVCESILALALGDMLGHQCP
jgi:hypothetical protein